MVMHINEDGMGPDVGQTTGGELRELRISVQGLRQQLTTAQAENEALREALREVSELDYMSMENALGWLEDNCRDIRALLTELDISEDRGHE